MEVLMELAGEFTSPFVGNYPCSFHKSNITDECES